MPDFELKPKQQKILMSVLLFIFLFFVALIVVNYYFGNKLLKDSNKYLMALSQVFGSQNQITYSEPLNKTSDPRLGDPEAKHLIFFFADFQCPYCVEEFANLVSFMQAEPKKALIIWKDVANPLHYQAEPAARAARCAQVQGKFWEYASGLFANQASLGRDFYYSLAQQLALDTAQFNSCYSTSQTASLVQDGLAEARALGINSTPYLFIDGNPVNGVITSEELKSYLNQ
jgi:protein-disulfide isomerase